MLQLATSAMQLFQHREKSDMAANYESSDNVTHGQVQRLLVHVLPPGGLWKVDIGYRLQLPPASSGNNSTILYIINHHYGKEKSCILVWQNDGRWLDNRRIKVFVSKSTV